MKRHDKQLIQIENEAKLLPLIHEQHRSLPQMLEKQGNIASKQRTTLLELDENQVPSVMYTDRVMYHASVRT